jgi:hypothetical protein
MCDTVCHARNYLIGSVRDNQVFVISSISLKFRAYRTYLCSSCALIFSVSDIRRTVEEVES